MPQNAPRDTTRKNAQVAAWEWVLSSDVPRAQARGIASFFYYHALPRSSSWLLIKTS